ncbi:MAG: excinuclease ABC subunit UvrC [Candidatus Rifleibacteriota bacterium]
MESEKLERILAMMPDNPGVYLMKNRVGDIIYIGKSRSLKKRVRSYFNRKHESIKTAVMVSAIENIEFIVTANEVEALILENNLIKKHKPRYNILLKDSKTHPYVRVTVKDQYPIIEKVRKVVFQDGNLYFGPFPNGNDLNRILDMLATNYRLCTSGKRITQTGKFRPCLKFHLGSCLGVCQGKISPEDYRKEAQKAVDVLSGKTLPDYTALNDQLEQFIKEYRYEEAAILRDTIVALKRFFESQKVEFVKQINSDIWGMSETLDRIVFSIFFVRSGKLLGNRIIDVERVPGAATDEVFSAIISQFYDRNLIPASIYTKLKPEGLDSLKELLAKRAGKKVHISVPKRGKFRQLLRMADANALEVLKSLKSDGADKISESVLDLQRRLNLNSPPSRIECIDISHIQGTDPVASLVVGVNGKPRKGEYRLFHIKNAAGGDDPASIGEVVRRRLGRLIAESLPLPDLLVVDGGIAQVRAARKEMNAIGVDFPVLGLAKREELLVAEDGTELKLPFSSAGMKVIIKLRNEAHRFANNFQKKTHARKVIRSSLLNLPGVGPRILKKVLWAFGSTDKVSKSSAIELSKKAGIPLKTAEVIIEALKNEDI